MNTYQHNLQLVIDRAVVELGAIPDEVFSAKPHPTKWSKKEILGHLIDSAYNNHQRFIRAQEEQPLIFGGYDQVAWVQKNAYQQRSSAEIIKTWQLVNLHLASMVGGLAESILNQQTAKHNFQDIGMRPVAATDAISLGYMIEDYIFHAEHHLAQIIEGYNWINPS